MSEHEFKFDNADASTEVNGVVYVGASETPVFFPTTQQAQAWAHVNCFWAPLGRSAFVFRKRGNRWEPMYKDAFKDEMATCKVLVGGEEVPFYNWWWNDPVARRNYDGLEYAPPGEQVTPGYRNTWNGFSVQPKQGDWSLMQAHISEILCNSDPILYEYVLDWLAQSVQYAGRPGRTALVLQGTKRTGKGVFAHAVRNLFGPHGFVANDGRQLVGNFNAQLENVSLLFADELRLMQPDVAPKFRSMLTEPTISIERKGVDLYLQKNTLHVIIASNDEQVVWTSGDERRYVILKVSSARANDAAYFGPLLAEQQPGGSGQAAMLYDLQQRDISKFNPEIFPHTKGFEDNVIQSMDGPVRWLYERLGDGTWGSGLDTWERVGKDWLLQQCKEDGNPKMTSTRLTRFLKEVFGEQFDPDQKDAQGNREYRFPPLAEARLLFKERMEPAGKPPVEQTPWPARRSMQVDLREKLRPYGMHPTKDQLAMAAQDCLDWYKDHYSVDEIELLQCMAKILTIRPPEEPEPAKKKRFSESAE